MFPDQVNLSYSNQSTSYRAGDDNYPVGNLNYFPTLKAKWEAGEVIGVDEEIAARRSAIGNYPNPFSHSTTIVYELKNSANVTLEVFNITGQKVRGLVSEFQQAGSYEVNFSPDNLPSGVYFYKLDTGSSISVGNMIYKK